MCPRAYLQGLATEQDIKWIIGVTFYNLWDKIPIHFVKLAHEYQSHTLFLYFFTFYIFCLIFKVFFYIQSQAENLLSNYTLIPKVILDLGWFSIC